ncbi:MAG: hypothetical protein ACJ77B_10235 [Chloroflexota bacterium]
MSRRSRYARAGQGGSSRPPRPDAARPGNAPAPRPWAAPPLPGPSIPTADTLADEPRPAFHPAPSGLADAMQLAESRESVAAPADRNGHGGHVAGNGHAPAGPPNGQATGPTMSPANGTGPNGHANAANGGSAGCTAPQLRRFIKSRTYVPMHELRRRFAINGGEDDVTLVEADGHRIFIGLPPREGRLVEELVRGGDIGVELSLDPMTPVVVGVYPMRPVPRG